VNGSVATIIPATFFLFDPPDPTIAEGSDYHDRDGSRRFCTDFYADLLHHLGASMVLRLGGANYDPAPFISRGIRVCGVEDLGCSAASLTEDADIGIFDRFAALAHAAGGPVALHGGSGECGGLRLAATLIAGWMAGLHFFPSAEAAAAWVQIARGCAAPVVWGPLRRYWAQRRPPATQAHTVTALLQAPQPLGLSKEPDSQIRRRGHHHHHHHHHGHRDHSGHRDNSGKNHHRDHSGHHAAAAAGHAMSGLHGRAALSAYALAFDRSESTGEGGQPRLHRAFSSRSSPALLACPAPAHARGGVISPSALPPPAAAAKSPLPAQGPAPSDPAAAAGGPAAFWRSVALAAALLLLLCLSVVLSGIKAF
jgi:hypothetical protein